MPMRCSVAVLVVTLLFAPLPVFCQGDGPTPGMVAWDLVNLASYAWNSMKLNLNQRSVLLSGLAEMYEQGDPATQEEMAKLAARYADVLWLEEDDAEAVYRKVKDFYKAHGWKKGDIEDLSSAPLPAGMPEADDDTDFIAWNLSRAAVRAWGGDLSLDQLNALYVALLAAYNAAEWQAQTPLKNLAGDEFGILKKWDSQKAGFPMQVRLTLGGLGVDVAPVRPLDEPMGTQTAIKMAMAYGNLATGLAAVDHWWKEEAQSRLGDGQHQTQTCVDAGVDEGHPEMKVLLGMADKLEAAIASLDTRIQELVASAAEPSARLREYHDTIDGALRAPGTADEADAIKLLRDAMAIVDEAQEFAAQYRRIFPDIDLVMQISNEAQQAGVDMCLQTIDSAQTNLAGALQDMLPTLLADASEALDKANASDNSTMMLTYALEARGAAELVLQIDPENQDAASVVDGADAVDAKVEQIMAEQIAQNRMPEETRTGGDWDAVKQAMAAAWAPAFPDEPIKRTVITSDFLQQAELHFEGNVAVVRHYRYITAYVAAQQGATFRVFRTQFRSIYTGDGWSALSYYKTSGSYEILAENIDA